LVVDVFKMSSPAVETAKTYALVGFIFYLIASLAGMIGSLATMIFMYMPSMTCFPMNIMFFPFGFFAIGIIFTVWAWITLKDIEAGKYSEAKTYSLILGIIGLFFAWLIGGIFFLLAYMKLGEITAPPPAVQPQRFCVNCGRAVPVDAKYCPYCGKELPQ
jgi:hypothetical protein